MSEPVVVVRHLTKRYDEFLAVDHIDLTIEQGQIFGLLGPNGAGKSTTIQMLLGLTIPDQGEITYFGRSFDKHRQWCLNRMNFASTYNELQGRMTIEQNLQIYAGLYGISNWRPRVDKLMDVLELEPYRHELFWHLSSGQRTRAIIAKSLLNSPQLLLMDEPTASLDPEITHKVNDFIRQLQEEEQLTILFTSHDMAEVTRMCDQVAFLAHGKIVMQDTPHELIKKLGATQLIIGFEAEQKLVEKYFVDHDFTHTFLRPDLVAISLAEAEIPKVLFGLKERDVWLTSIATEKPSLEDVFLHVSAQQRQDQQGAQ
jgi:ABC-2 type transport system ATP-binding protein